MNSRKDHSIAKTLESDTQVDELSLSSFKDDIRSAERDRLRSAQKRNELLEELRKKYKSPSKDNDRSEFKKEILKSLLEGGSSDIESAIYCIKRDLKGYEQKHNISRKNQILLKNLFERSKILISQKKLHETLSAKLQNIQMLEEKPDSDGNVGLQTAEINLANILSKLEFDLKPGIDEAASIYSHFENRFQTDLACEERASTLFFIAANSLSQPMREKFISVYEIKCKPEPIDRRTGRLNQLVELLASKSEKISNKIHAFIRRSARKLIASGALKQAVEELQYALTLDKHSVETLRMLSDIFAERNESRKLVRVLSELIRLEPQNIRLIKRSALLHERLKEWKSASELYHSALDMSSDDPELVNKYIHALYHMGDFQTIVCFMGDRMKNFEHAEKIKKWMGVSLCELRRETEAIIYLEEAHAMDPSDKETFHHLILALRRTNQHEQALLYLEEKRKRSPDSLSVLLLLGSTQMENGDDRNALNTFQHICRIHPPTVSVLYSTGEIAERTNDMTTAENFYRKALELDPDHEDSLFSLARLFRNSKRLDESEAILIKALRNSPANQRVKQELAAVYIDNGNWREASQLMKNE